MKLNISDLLDDIYDDDIELIETDITTPDRILALVQEQMTAEAEAAPVISVQPSKHRQLGKLARTILIAAALTLSLTVTALAVGGNTFFQSIFGSKGMEAIPGGQHGDDIYPSRQWAEVDERAANDILGAYVNYNEHSVSLYGYTLTIEEVLIDENDIGVISYCLSNPEGLPKINMVGDAWPGHYTFDRSDNDTQWLNDMLIYTISGDSPHALDYYTVLDASRTTGTELHAVQYFRSYDPLSARDTLYAYFSCDIANGASNELGWQLYDRYESEPIAIATDNRAPTVLFRCGELTAHLSALGLAVDPPAGTAERVQASLASGEPEESYWGWLNPGEFEIAGISIEYADGSEYTVYTAEPFLMNTIAMYTAQKTQRLYAIFNRFVDVDNVSSIVITSTDGEVLTFTPEI